jgi:hypothetical protein
MRGLIRFDMPAGLAGRATVSSAKLQLTTRGLGTETSPGTAATVSLFAVTTPWSEGSGIGNTTMAYTVGSACTVGATWNRSNCATGVVWNGVSTTVAGSASGSAAVPAAVNATVTWNTPGMAADVQGWIDATAGNYGWLMTSSTEGGTNGLAQRFFSSDEPSAAPSLEITYACKPGFAEVGNSCTTVSIDVDDNGVYDALTDGLLIIRHLYGLTDAALTAGAIGPNANRSDPAQVKEYLDGIQSALDVDANNAVEPATDGLMVLRYLFGFRDPAVSAGALGQNPTRTGSAIDNYIRTTLMSP